VLNKCDLCAATRKSAALACSCCANEPAGPRIWRDRGAVSARCARAPRNRAGRRSKPLRPAPGDLKFCAAAFWPRGSQTGRRGAIADNSCVSGAGGLGGCGEAERVAFAQRRRVVAETLNRERYSMCESGAGVLWWFQRPAVSRRPCLAPRRVNPRLGRWKSAGYPGVRSPAPVARSWPFGWAAAGLGLGVIKGGLA